MPGFHYLDFESRRDEAHEAWIAREAEQRGEWAAKQLQEATIILIDARDRLRRIDLDLPGCKFIPAQAEALQDFIADFIAGVVALKAEIKAGHFDEAIRQYSEVA
jgi:hypothetical protein